jgi:apolipoprotein N-acyltransferase
MPLKTGLKVVAIPISGVLYAAAFPPLEIFGLMPLALALLFWALQEVPPGPALLAGFTHGLISYGIGVSWLWNVFGPMSLALFGILAAFHALFGLGFSLVRLRLPSSRAAPFVIAALWTLLEFTRGELFWLKFPWFGVGLARGPHWLLPWLGLYAVTFLTTSAVLALLQKSTRLIGVALLLMWALPGIPLPLPTPTPTETTPAIPIPIAAVQAEMAGLKTYLKLSAETPPETRLWIWPEYAYASDLTRNKRDHQAILDFLKSRPHPDAILVLGTHTWVGDEGWHNTALTLNASGSLGSHFKNHSVHLFDDGIPGTEARPVETPVGPVGTPICFDCDFQDVVRRMTASGAAFIVSPTMDAISWSLRQHEQHARLFQIRAAENRRWIAVAATSGVTQIIDPTGRVTARLPLVKEATLSGTLHARSDLTFFTRYGHHFPWLLALLFVLPLLRKPVLIPKPAADPAASSPLSSSGTAHNKPSDSAAAPTPLQ